MSRLLVLLVACVFTATYGFIGLRTSTVLRRLTASGPLFAVPVLGENAMSIDEIKAELELRGVDFSECVSKQELVEKLISSRATGKADPSILNNLKDVSDTAAIMSEIDDEVFERSVAKDGTLPGGLSKELMKALASDPEVMQMLMNPKMQDIMKAVMSGGPDAMKKYLSDPDAIKVLNKLSTVMQRVNKK